MNYLLAICAAKLLNLKVAWSRAHPVVRLIILISTPLFCAADTISMSGTEYFDIACIYPNFCNETAPKGLAATLNRYIVTISPYFSVITKYSNTAKAKHNLIELTSLKNACFGFEHYHYLWRFFISSNCFIRFL